ncbi:hypothetical protein DSM106972_047820 [Dulcicalothrix desertica PCC 7102]|uniref:Uncharacterized protein n=1 Tax=Dulcicalothrix desertica PCC 7102 TaxID=232991 RepID=A0A433VCR7_9CYAN|nr:type III-B CRISPR-associated protein Cas10/Cmr2 [Dulcicalothrix desertica]RUT03868.1 hypothetical protein DSM106972_047820 [Dulcicalothrix desertica PCC 7102]TWH43721.1 CRISPR-associated protein Cmr2 [Dulcicalothrix desertica PCC 7102]
MEQPQSQPQYTYTVVTYAPVQGSIEKSRKLRDLFGASNILSFLSLRIVQAAGVENVISPGLVHIQKGMSNRILIKGHFSYKDAHKALLDGWKLILRECKAWIEDKLSEFKPYYWHEEWNNWGNHAWELFWGSGTGNTESEAITAAMKDLETRKLSRAWTALNWMGESSSLTGSDAIAYPKLGNKKREIQDFGYGAKDEEITKFYIKLAEITEYNANQPSPDGRFIAEGGKLVIPEVKPQVESTMPNEQLNTPEGKFITPDERLSIPELVKRLVTWHEIVDAIGIQPLEQGFREIQRKPTKDTPGQWTGWFMGDGDKVGDKLIEFAGCDNAESNIRNFSNALREWGQGFYKCDLGRVIYAGGDDFLGIIYSSNPAKPIKPLNAFKWLMGIPKKWEEHKQDITLSVGFVWVAGSVPQRDVLQHCREAQAVAKSRQRNRVTIRVLFNSGQYVEWTCPWDYLDILQKYRDRNGNTLAKWEEHCRRTQQNSNEIQEGNYKYFPNWSHVYGDLAELKVRHAFGLAPNRREVDINSLTTNQQNKIIQNRNAFLDFFNIYFPNVRDILIEHENYIVGINNPMNNSKPAQAMIDWIENLITVGWYLCGDGGNE